MVLSRSLSALSIPTSCLSRTVDGEEEQEEEEAEDFIAMVVELGMLRVLHGRVQ